MSHHSVHMRDQKANQMAMLARNHRQVLSDIVEEIALVVMLWGVFLLSSN